MQTSDRQQLRQLRLAGAVFAAVVLTLTASFAAAASAGWDVGKHDEGASRIEVLGGRAGIQPATSSNLIFDEQGDLGLPGTPGIFMSFKTDDIPTHECNPVYVMKTHDG